MERVRINQNHSRNAAREAIHGCAAQLKIRAGHGLNFCGCPRLIGRWLLGRYFRIKLPSGAGIESLLSGLARKPDAGEVRMPVGRARSGAARR